MKLIVTANEQKIGIVSFDSDSGLFGFDYAPDWLAQAQRFPLSPALPFERADITAEQHSASIRQFFQNLLPEGQALDDAAAANRLSKSNLMGLLIALGQETAGALVISLPDKPISAATTKRELHRDELSTRIRSRPNHAFSVWDGKVLLSIAGHQDKIALLVDDGHWFLVDGRSIASTHILKPDPIRLQLQHMTSNELACMRLAKAVGLPTAEIKIEWIPEPIVLIERFDRLMTGQSIQRLHCIDGCQALGLGVSMKYERPYGDTRDVQHIRDGASLPKLFTLIDAASANPAADRLALLRWIIFQILIGNTDAHGKNLSFFIDAAGLRLTPAYALVCCLLYTDARIADTLAMAIGDNFNPNTLTAYDWALMADECQLNPKLVSRELTQLAKKTIAIWPTLQQELIKDGADAETLNQMGEIFLRQSIHSLKLAPQIIQIARDLF
jgi:serine/threonine-protein kinase HipA